MKLYYGNSYSHIYAQDAFTIGKAFHLERFLQKWYLVGLYVSPYRCNSYYPVVLLLYELSNTKLGIYNNLSRLLSDQ